MSEASQEPPRGLIVITVGLPGSGKSTWFERRGILPLSTDLLRKLLLDDESDQSRQNHVFAALYGMLRRRLAIGRPATYVDATNLNSAERRTYFKIAQEYDGAVDAIFFDVPVEVCVARNAARHRVVPAEVMEKFAKKLEAPSYAEGFREIAVIDAEGNARPMPR